MYNIPGQLKTIYKNDFLPAVPQNYFKYLLMYFPELDITIDTRDSGRIDIDSFSLDESLCSASDLTLGSCEASIMKIKINGIVQDLTGKKVIVTQYIIDGDTTYEMPYGTFWVKTAGKQSDLGFKELTMFDAMLKSDVDVSAWYNGLTWPQTYKSMRESLLTYLGVEFEIQTVTNDTEQVPKTINPTSLIGRDVLRRITEINAGFGHFTRDGKFKVIQLSGLGLYPSETLYPAEDLFPSESGEYITAGYESADYEEYTVEPITSVTVREDDEDTGATAGIPGNNYIITGNYLLYGKSAGELQTIVDNIFLQVKNKYYRPHNTTMIGLPYMEVGDSVTIITSNDAIESFIFKRTLTGIQALKDNISASGNQVRNQKVSPMTEIQQTKSKVLKIQKNVDQLSIDMTDMEEGLQSQITLTAGQLQTQITDNKNNADSQFTQQANAIALKVNQNGVISAINLSPETAKIESPNIQLEGIVTANNYFQVLLDGSIKAVNGEFSGKIKAAIIEGEGITCTKDGLTTVIKDGTISTSYMGAGTVLAQQVKVTGTSGQTTDITGLYIDTKDITCEDIICNSINANSHYHYDLTDGSGTVRWNGSKWFPWTSGADLGDSTHRWGTLYATSGTINTSDRDLKHDIEDLSEVYKQLILRCRPVRFKYNDGSSDRYHTGFISQEVEAVMQELGIDNQDFAGFVKSPVYSVVSEDGVFDTSSEITGYIYMLRYEEFISPIAAVIQDQEARINRLEQILLASKAGEQQNG